MQVVRSYKLSGKYMLPLMFKSKANIRNNDRFYDLQSEYIDKFMRGCEYIDKFMRYVCVASFDTFLESNPFVLG